MPYMFASPFGEQNYHLFLQNSPSSCFELHFPILGIELCGSHLMCPREADCCNKCLRALIWKPNNLGLNPSYVDFVAV